MREINRVSEWLVDMDPFSLSSAERSWQPGYRPFVAAGRTVRWADGTMRSNGRRVPSDSVRIAIGGIRSTRPTLPDRHGNQGEDPGRLDQSGNGQKPLPRGPRGAGWRDRFGQSPRRPCRGSGPVLSAGHRACRRPGHKTSLGFRHHDAELFAEGGVEIVDVVEIFAAVCGVFASGQCGSG